MTSPLKYSGKYPTLCGVCRRRASHIGYTPQDKQPIMWICEHPTCIETAKRVYGMKSNKLDAHEAKAVEAGGLAAGQYADEINRMNIGEMSEDEWREFCNRMILGYSQALQKSLAELNAPF